MARETKFTRKVAADDGVSPEENAADQKFTITAENAPYRPYGSALKLWSCRDEEILYEGPAGTGKSRGVLEKIHYCCLKYRGCRALIVRKTRESMTESTLATYEEKVLPSGDSRRNGPKRALRQHYAYPETGALLVIGGMDKSSKIMSTEWDIIGVFEGTELGQGEYEDLTTRLRNGRMPYQQIVVDCNPAHKQHWLNLRAKEGLMTRIRSKHEDNPMLFNHATGQWHPRGAGYIAKLDRLSGARKRRLRFGEWATSEGVVYEDFDAQIHVVDRITERTGRRPPANWRKIRVFDFGFIDPFVCLWIAVDPDGRMYVYRELYMTRRLTREHAAKVIEYSKGEMYEANISDWDAENRADLEECGIVTVPAFKEIDRGREAVAARLKVQRDGKPRLMLLRDALIEQDSNLIEAKLPYRTEDEFDAYVWKKMLTTEQVKDEPADKFNHGMDALRYACGYIDDLASEVADVQVDAATSVAMPTDKEIEKYGRPMGTERTPGIVRKSQTDAEIPTEGPFAVFV